MVALPEVLKDVDGADSSKRVAAFWALGLFSLAVIVDLILALRGGRPPSDTIVNALVWIIGGGFLTIVAERFGKAPAAPQQQPPP